MTTPTPLTFTDEQMIQAVKVAPEQIQAQLSIIAMQLELQERREADNADS